MMKDKLSAEMRARLDNIDDKLSIIHRDIYDAFCAGVIIGGCAVVALVVVMLFII
jgi:hypothetical protein